MSNQETLKLTFQEASKIIEEYLSQYVETYKLQIKCINHQLLAFTPMVYGDPTTSKYNKITSFQLYDTLKRALIFKGYFVTKTIIDLDKVVVSCDYYIEFNRKRKR